MSCGSIGPSISGSAARTRSPSCTLMWAPHGSWYSRPRGRRRQYGADNLRPLGCERAPPYRARRSRLATTPPRPMRTARRAGAWRGPCARWRATSWPGLRPKPATREREANRQLPGTRELPRRTVERAVGLAAEVCAKRLVSALVEERRKGAGVGDVEDVEGDLQPIAADGEVAAEADVPRLQRRGVDLVVAAGGTHEPKRRGQRIGHDAAVGARDGGRAEPRSGCGDVRADRARVGT